MDDQRTDRKSGGSISEECKLPWYTLRADWVGKAAWALIRRIRFSLKTLLFAMTILILVASRAVHRLADLRHECDMLLGVSA
jgi:hypothetical protein